MIDVYVAVHEVKYLKKVLSTEDLTKVFSNDSDIFESNYFFMFVHLILFALSNIMLKCN